MPLAEGYSIQTFRANYAELCKSGNHTRESALAAAYAKARVSFFHKHPRGALPLWLSFPRKYRLRNHYDRNGRPITVNPIALLAPLKALSHIDTARSLFRRNPRTQRRQPRNDAEIRAASKLFEDFAGKKATTVRAIELGKQPRTGLAFGELIEVGYKSFRDGRPYRHTFWPTKSRPLLVATHDGKQVLLLGGAYTFTERGIENK
jgi:hypothetical protein